MHPVYNERASMATRAERRPVLTNKGRVAVSEFCCKCASQFPWSPHQDDGDPAPKGSGARLAGWAKMGECPDSFRSKSCWQAPFRRRNCGVVRSVVLEFQTKLPGFGQHDERAWHQIGAHDDSAMGATQYAGI